MLVLDTNTLIYFFKGLGQVASNLYACSPLEIAIPTVVLYELHVGIQKSTHPDKRLPSWLLYYLKSKSYLLTVKLLRPRQKSE